MHPKLEFEYHIYICLKIGKRTRDVKQIRTLTQLLSRKQFLLPSLLQLNFQDEIAAAQKCLR